MDLVIYGLNHRTAPLPVRERWAFSGEEARQALLGMQDRLTAPENLILSTCNRTEIYSLLPGGSPSSPPADLPVDGESRSLEELLDFCHRLKNCGRETDHSYFYTLRRQEAVEHLFRVAAGLDSMIVGESQILRQIRDAYDLARGAGAVGKVFGKLFPAALRTGKRTRAETGISRGSITHGQAAVQAAREALGDLAQKRVLLLGSGKASRLAAEALVELGAGRIAVMNRTLEKAVSLAARIGGDAFPLEDLPSHLQSADLVISSTGSTRPLVPAGLLEKAVLRRGGRPLCIIDLAVPRDFDPACAGIPSVSLHNIDDLNERIQKNLCGRLTEVSRAESIVKEELRAFLAQMNWVHLDPVIRHLVERFEAIRVAEVERHIGSIPPQHRESVEALTSALIKKIVHFPIEKLKSLRDGAGLTPDQIAFLRRLFLNDAGLNDASLNDAGLNEPGGHPDRDPR